LLESQLPDIDGVEVLLRIRNHTPTARMIVFTRDAYEEAVYRGIRAGAKGFLLKETATHEIVNTIRAVHQGHTRIADDAVMKLIQRPSSRDVSRKELEVLRLMMRGATNKDIAGKMGISEYTARAHVHNILTKLGARDRTQAVIIALKRGLITLSG